jgi:hypothetical protein
MEAVHVQRSINQLSVHVYEQFRVFFDVLEDGCAVFRLFINLCRGNICLGCSVYYSHQYGDNKKNKGNEPLCQGFRSLPEHPKRLDASLAFGCTINSLYVALPSG